MVDKVALVTGSNKGIGHSIVRELCARGVKVVYLASRDLPRGKAAIENLKRQGLNAQLIQLEVTDEASVKAAAEYIKNKNGGLDILVNNAAIIAADWSKTPYEESKRIIDVNYRSLFIVEKYLYPILNENARVVNIGSDCSHISNLRNKYWIERLTNPDLKVEDIDEFLKWFLDAVKDNALKEEDFAEMHLLAYKISKIALVALTRIQQKNIGRGISINAIHPGFVQTDMTKGNGFFTMEEASKAPVYLALDVPQSVKGQYYWFDKTPKDWTDPTLELYCKVDMSIFDK